MVFLIKDIFAKAIKIQNNITISKLKKENKELKKQNNDLNEFCNKLKKKNKRIIEKCKIFRLERDDCESKLEELEINLEKKKEIKIETELMNEKIITKKEKRRIYREKNKQKIKERAKLYNEKNKQKIKKYKKDYYEKNKIK